MDTRAQIAQGDVMLLPWEQLPPGCRRLHTQVLARGETTGHEHRVTGDAELWLAPDDTMWVVAPGPAELVHDEHGPHEIVGIYEYRPQGEPDPFVGVRRVTD